MLKRRPNRKLLIIAGLGIGLALSMPALAQSASDCAARADRAARGTVGAVGGAASGAAGGAAIGAIVKSDSRKGARKGARIGAAVGATSGAVNRNSTYKRVYDDCMAGRYGNTY